MRRVHQHNHDDKAGAKYTKSRRPVRLVCVVPSPTRSEACKLKKVEQRKEKAINWKSRHGDPFFLALKDVKTIYCYIILKDL